MGAEDRERLLWADAYVDWSGEDYTLTIPAQLDPWAARWLDRQLGARLGGIAGAEAARGSAEAARPIGKVVIAGLSERWPDAAALREAVGQAVEDAYAAAGEARAHARSFEQLVQRRD
jgi:hypothetical protein